VEQLPPAITAALYQLDEQNRDERPMRAAHWLAEGMDGDVLRELAWRSAGDREVDDLWPGALAELGVEVPIARPRRVVMAWAAQQVVAGKQDARWLVSLLAPWHVEDGDEEMDQLIYSLDDWLDYAERALSGKHGYDPAEAVAPLADVRATVEAMIHNDVAGACAVWTPPPPGA
jgi:hypothetical protein